MGPVLGKLVVIGEVLDRVWFAIVRGEKRTHEAAKPVCCWVYLLWRFM